MARRGVVGARRRLDDQQPRFALAKPPLDLVEQLRARAFALKRRMRGDPIEIVDAIRSRRRAVTDVSDELTFARERPDELVIRHAVARIVRRPGRSRREGLVEQLERDRDFVVAKHRRRVENLTNAIAMAPLQGAEPYLHLTPRYRRNGEQIVVGPRRLHAGQLLRERPLVGRRNSRERGRARARRYFE